MTYNEEQAKAAYDRLPEAVKEIFGDIQTEDDLVEIGREHHLHIDQIGKLNQQVTLVLLGLEPAKNFVADIKREVNLDQNSANEIADKINSAIFLKIRGELETIANKTAATTKGENTPTTSAEPGAATPPNNLPTADNKVEPDLLQKKLSGTFVLPRVESATKEDVAEVDVYREPTN